ncbi:MAG TPA: redoxin domain-containing protein [Saprospiraceae bacterium]|nr:redoxin domain-containing protein [Saprospiraceae bacterium]HMP12232.1 redoxin domain-containing protein [Saprospiraceae bacterium]
MKIFKHKSFWIGFGVGFATFVVSYLLITFYIAYKILPRIEKATTGLSAGMDFTNKAPLPGLLEKISNEGEIDTISWNGKPYFIHFWATWCKPCLAEMDQIETLYESLSNQVDFYVLSNEDLSKQQKFLLTKDWNLPFYKYSDTMFAELPVKVLPTTYIGKNGYLYFQQIGSKSNWNAQFLHHYFEAMSK